MFKEAEILLIKLVSQNNNLMEVMKIENEPKKLKSIEKDITKNNCVIKVITQYINYYKIKK